MFKSITEIGYFYEERKREHVEYTVSAQTENTEMWEIIYRMNTKIGKRWKKEQIYQATKKLVTFSWPVKKPLS